MQIAFWPLESMELDLADISSAADEERALFNDYWALIWKTDQSSVFEWTVEELIAKHSLSVVPSVISKIAALGGTAYIAGYPCEWEGCGVRLFKLNPVRSRQDLLERLRAWSGPHYCEKHYEENQRRIAARHKAQDDARRAAEAAQSEARVRARAQRRFDLDAEWGERLIGDCPRCDEFLVLRFNSRTLGPFVGCTSWRLRGPADPGCGYTRRLPIDEEIRFADWLRVESAAIVARIRAAAKHPAGRPEESASQSEPAPKSRDAN